DCEQAAAGEAKSLNNYNHPLSAPRKRYYPNLWVISFLIKDEIVKRDLKARKGNSPVDCF
ncbi:hypothetical protein, partial [Ruminococcus sp.]